MTKGEKVALWGILFNSCLGVIKYIDIAENKLDIIPNPIIDLEKQKGSQLINLLKQHGVDTVISRGNLQNKGILTLLRNAGIRHITVNCESIKEFINKSDNGNPVTISTASQHNINVS